METIIGIEASKKIKDLIEAGWEFMLFFGDHSTWCEIEGRSWEACFTRKKDDGKWGNFKSKGL